MPSQSDILAELYLLRERVEKLEESYRSLDLEDIVLIQTHQNHTYSLINENKDRIQTCWNRLNTQQGWDFGIAGAVLMYILFTFTS